MLRQRRRIERILVIVGWILWIVTFLDSCKRIRSDEESVDVETSIKWQNDKSCGKDMFCECDKAFKVSNPELCKITHEQVSQPCQRRV